VRLKAALLGRSRGGQTSKIHVAGDRKCRPVAFILTVGQAADSPQFIPVLGKAERGPSLVWCIGRRLLHRGLTAMSGCGDVRMWPALPRERPSSWLLLESQEVEAVFEVPAAPLAQWLGRDVPDHPGRDGDGRAELGRLPQGTARRPGDTVRMTTPNDRSERPHPEDRCR
jgi:hypothetical protein